MTYKFQVKLDFTVKCEFTEQEARALDAIVGYGHEAFLEVFKKHMGKSYISEHEAAVPELFAKLNNMKSSLHRIDEAKKLLKQLADIQ